MRTRLDNNVLAAFAQDDWDALLPSAAFVSLPGGSVLARPGEALSFVFFPTSGIVSVVYTSETGHQMDVAAVGADGFIGIGSILQIHSSPYSYTVLLESTGYRIASSAFERAFATRSSARSAVLAYTGRVILHAERAEICQRFHLHNQRVAHWLLQLCHRSRLQSMPLTHDVIARMLGTTRHAVTEALAELRDRGAITYSRGRVEILDQELLRVCGCECATTAM